MHVHNIIFHMFGVIKQRAKYAYIEADVLFTLYKKNA
jgi:hypothetical protein